MKILLCGILLLFLQFPAIELIAGIDKISVTVTPDPAGKIFRAGENIALGADVSFEGGEVAYNTVWRKIGRTDTLSQENTLQLENLTGIASGRYYCAVYENGSKTAHYSDTVGITVIDTKVNAYGFTRLCIGDRVEYAVSVSDTFRYAYAWYKVGSDVPLVEADHYVIDPIEAGHAGGYYCKIKDLTHNFEFWSDTLDVTVAAYPSIALTVNGTANNSDKKFSFCYGTEVSMEVSNTEAGQPETRFLWTGNSIGGEAGDATVKVNLKRSGMYYAMVTHKGCVREDSVKLEMRRPDVVLPQSRYAIAGESVTLESSVPDENYRYFWSNGDAANVSNAAKYTFNATEGKSKVVLRIQTNDALKCEKSDSCIVIGLPAINYTTSKNDGFVTSREALKIIQGDTTLCARQPLTLEVAYTGYDGYTYEWMKIESGVTSPADTGRIMDIASAKQTSGISYFCRAYDVEQGGYVYSDTVKVVVKYTPIAEITDPDPSVRQCGGYLLTLKGKDADKNSPLTKYRWEGSGIIGTNEAADLQAKLGVNSYYKLVVSVDGCADSAEINIPTLIYSVDIASQIILPQPANEVSFVAAKPEDGELTWLPNGDATRMKETGNHASVLLDILAGDTAVIVKMQKGGCEYYDTCRVLIREFKPSADEEALDDGFAISLPILRVTATDPRVCLGQDITLSVYDLGYDNYKYEWKKVAAPNDITGLSDSISYTIFRADASDAGKYYCVATDPENPGVLIYSDTLNLSLTSGPLAEIAKDYVSLCYDDIVEIKALTSYAGSGSSSDPAVADALVWEGPGILEGQGTNSIKVRVGDIARYKLTASKNGGCWSMDTISFPVVKPQVRIVPPVTFLYTPGEVKLTVQSNSTSFEWSQNGSPSAETGAAASMNFSDDGYATVTVEQGNCVAKDTAYIFMKQQDSYFGGENDGFIISRPYLVIPSELKNIYACPDTLLTFWVIHPEFQNYKYQWWKVINGSDPVLVHDGAEYRFNVKDSDGGRYYCTAVDSDAPDGQPPYIYSDTIYLQVNNGPVAEIAYDKLETCFGGILSLDASASANGVGGVVTYEWIGEGIQSGADQARVEVSPEVETVYTVRVSNSTCSDTASVTVKVVHPKIEIPSRVHLPAPDNAYVLDATVPDGVTVEWSFRPDETGISVPGNGAQIDVTADGWAIAKSSTVDGCVGYDSCRIFVKNPVGFQGGIEDGFSLLEVSTRVWLEPQQEVLELCLNQELQLTAMVSGLSRYAYSWHRVESDTESGVGEELGTEEILKIDHVLKDQEGHYYCIVTDIEDIATDGTKKKYYSDTVRLDIKDGPIAHIRRLDGTDSWSACVGSSIELVGELKNSAFTGGFITYDWSQSQDYFEETNDPQIIEASPRGNGRYALTVSDSKSKCSDTYEISFEMRAPVVKIPETYQFAKPGTQEISAVVGGEGKFTWYRRIYSEGNAFDTKNPVSVQFQQDETIIVRFEQDGCFGFDTTQIFVKNQGTFIGGAEDGFVASTLPLKAWVTQKSQEVCRGGNIEIPIHVADVGRVLRYKWYKVGDQSHTVLSEERTLVLRANQMSDGGEYYCVVADPAIADVNQKTVHSDTATVTMINGPLAKISKPTANELKGIFCRGSEITISAEATEDSKVNSNDIYKYEWFGENISYSAYDYEISARMANSGRYIVKASLGECFTYDTVHLNIYEPKVDIQSVIFLSKEDDITLSVKNPDKNTIRWSFYYEQMTDPILQKVGDTLNAHVLDDAYVIVERIESQCSGYDTCHIFVKDVRSFTGGEEDGFMSKGSGFYYKPIEFTDEVCEGNVATLYVPVVGDDFYRYKWTKVGDESRRLPEAALCKFESVTKEDEGYYYCTITDVNSNRSLITDRVYLSVKEMPKSSILVDDQEVCFGETITLKADQNFLKADVQYSYLWSGKGITTRIMPETQVKVEEDGVYQLLVSDGDCYVADTVSLKALKTQLEVETVHHVMKGSGLTIWGSVNKDSSVMLTWEVGTNLYRDVNPLVLSATSLTRSVPFTVSTTGKCSVERKGNIYLRDLTPYAGGNDDGYVLPNDLPQLLNQSDELLGCDTTAAVLWVTAIETDDLRYRWQKYAEAPLSKWVDMVDVVGKNNVTGCDTARLKFSSIEAEDEGRYRCKLSNTYGYTFSREVRLVKGGKPKVTKLSVNKAVCEGKEFRFVTSVSIPNGGTESGTGLVWKWYYSKDGLNFSQKLPEQDYANPYYVVEKSKEADEGYYIVEATNYCGSSSDTTFQEIWEAPSFVQQPENKYICNGGIAELTTEVKGGGTYGYEIWQVEVDRNGNYVSDIRCIQSKLSSPTFTIDPVESSYNGYYVWRAYNECATTQSKTFRLIVEDEIIPVFETVDTVVCAGTNQNLVLLANNNIQNPTTTLKYAWKKDGADLPTTTTRHTISRVVPADAGIYICYARHACDWKEIKQFKVGIKELPKIILPISLKPDYCEGTENLEMLIDYTSDAGEVGCTWVHNGVDLVDNGHFSGSRTAKFVIDTLIASDAGKYYVKLRNECGTLASEAVNLKVKLPAVITTPLDSVTMCLGSSVTLSVRATGEAPIIYYWMKDGVRIPGASTSSLALNNVSYNDAGLYRLVAQNECNIKTTPYTESRVSVITPKIYNLQGGGAYCADDFREVTLSGFEKGVVYTLKRRQRLDETNYVTLKTVDGDTVSTRELTFGRWGAGYYHVEATALKEGVSCGAQMNGEIYIYQNPTPKQFDFYVSDPMCTGEKAGTLTLAGSEKNTDILYTLQIFNERYGAWSATPNKLVGTGEPMVWPNLKAGVYRLIAENIESGCAVQIGENDTIAERPYPETYSLFAVGGDTTACYGMESDVVLQLSGSEKTSGYTLYRDGESTDRTVSGNLISWDKVTGGTYTVRARTNYGCEKDMGSVSVTDLPQLKQWLLDGGIVYCEEQAGEEHQIILGGSIPGIRYDFYALSSSDPLASEFGNGEQLVWKVNLDKDETYYVVAEDTVDHCIQVMADSVSIEANHLRLSVIPEKTINASTVTNLEVDIYNAIGNPVVTWEPHAKIDAIDPVTHTATTKIMNKGELFIVHVEDQFCAKDTAIKVLVEGEPLDAEIRASNCYTPIDTLFLCRGENVDLCSFISGGGSTYQFKWTDDYYTDSIPVPHKSKISYTRKDNQDGFVVLHVVSVIDGATGPTVLQAEDTVWIAVRERPDIFLANAALDCVVPGADTAIVLTATEAGVGYRLDYRPLQTVPYVKKDSITGDGGEGRFEIPAYSVADNSGYYRIIATKVYKDAVCETRSEAIQLQRSPERHIVSSGAITTYCEGERQDTIYVDRTEQEVTYRLLKDRQVQIEQKTGNDGKLSFIGEYGTGSYQVIAMLGRCIDTMANRVEIEAMPRPVIDHIEGIKDYCASDEVKGIKVVLPSPRPTVRYRIYKEGFFKEVAEEYGGYEEVELWVKSSDELVDLTGNYYVEAYDPANHCTDTVKGLVVTPTPGTLKMDVYEFTYCDNLSGVDGKTILVTGADPLIHYELHGPDGNKVGDFDRLKDDTICYRGTLAVVDGAMSTDYDVYANAGGCSGVLASFTVKTSIAPKEFDLVGNPLGCIGYPHSMGVKVPATNVDYYLYKEGEPDYLSKKKAESGDIELVFGEYSELGTYYVVAENAAHCTRRLSQEYVIRELPDFFKIYTPGNTAYCEGDRGVQLGITGTQSGVTYFLQKEDTVGGIAVYQDVNGVEVVGTGSSATLFAGYYQVGKYRIRTDYCDLLMLDTLQITEKPLPALLSATYSGMACVDSTMSISIDQPETGTDYTLHYEGVPTGLATLPGSGEVKWEIPVAANGMYTVLAQRDGCTLTMNDSIRPGEVAKIGNLEGIVTNKCFMDKSDLYLQEWESGAEYRLYSKVDTVVYLGKEVGGQIVFTDVNAGFNYYVSATNKSCTAEKGVFDFPGIALPELQESDWSIVDCRDDGQAMIALKNLKSGYEYTLTQKEVMKDFVINSFAGDTLLEKLSNGTYAFVAYDPVTTCTSLPLEATIRGGVPRETIVSPLEYCQGTEGVRIELSAQTYGISYSIRNLADGSVVDRDPENKVFNKMIPAGRYELYRERVGLWGGCWASDTFTVQEYPYPSKTILNVELPEGTLCETGNNAIVIHESEVNVHYILQNAVTKANIDTIYGNGGSIVFAGRKPKGSYNIVMRYAGLCEKTYFKTLQVSGVPPQATASNCEYCYDAAGTDADGCALTIAGLDPSAQYILYTQEGNPVDTLYGTNAGFFDVMPEGDYYVTGTYEGTKCSDIVAAMSVHKLTQPRVFPITNANGGGDCTGSVDVALMNGCEGDSVKYYLYMNDFYKVEGPVKSDGNTVRFSTFRTPGTYRVFATKGVDEKCGAWMEGQVVLYARPANAEMTVQGYNCSESASSEVSVTAKKTELNWFYYISDGTNESEHKEGIPNGELVWNSIGGKSLKTGQYILYAKNACDSVIAMDTAQVYDAAAPRDFKLKKFKEGVYCDGNDGYRCVLDGSEKGVTYTLQYKDEKWTAEGTGTGELYLANVVIPSASGLCTVYATVDSSQCTYALDTLTIRKDFYTDHPGFDTKSVCGAEDATLTIRLTKPRVPYMDYYLLVNGHAVDTIFGDNMDWLDRAFDPQSELGCYSVYVTSKTRQCDTVYPAPCLSAAPEQRHLKAGWDGELCEGSSRELVLENPQPGVTYVLKRNGESVTNGVNGSADTLVLGTISQVGQYTVVATVTDECTAYMPDTVDVKMLPLPELHVNKVYTCLEGEQVEIVVQRPTSPQVYYQIKGLTAPAGTYKQADGDAVSLGKFGKGAYEISTFDISDNFVCVAKDTVVVNEIGVEKFKLEVIGDEYMCEANECRTLKLSGSEKGAYYELFRATGKDTAFIASATGTGKAIDFKEQCDTGYYFVIASKDVVDPATSDVITSKVQMGDAVHLYVASKIEKYVLSAAVNGYCYYEADGITPASPSGSIILQGSQSDAITYKLYRNGNYVPTKDLSGTSGGSIRWSGLEGKRCDGNSDEGNVYTVIATDGRCEVEMSGRINIMAVDKPIPNRPTISFSSCTGETAPMVANASGCMLNYEWRFNGEVVGNSVSYIIDSLRMEDMGIYECTISNYCGRVDITPITVDVREVVRMPERMDDKMICGSNAEKVELVSSAVGENYYWYRPGHERDTISKSAKCTLVDVNETDDAGEYVCCTWNSCGALYDTIRLEFNRVPEVTGYVAKIDTLCVGTEYSLKLQSRDTLYWYCNDKLIAGKHDHWLKFDSIVPTDAGKYKVVAKNACNSKEFNIRELYVDDTLRVVSAPALDRHYCQNEPLKLEIVLNDGSKNYPDRVTYTWRKRNLVVQPEAGKPYAYSGGNASLRDDGAWFEVSYSNKCNTGSATHNVHVDKPISLASFAKDSVVSVCAAPGVTEILIVDDAQREQPEYNNYQWFRRNADGTATLIGETDTLKVLKQVSNSGKYYCALDNTCGSALSGDVDLRIDSMPVIKKQPMAQPQYCANTPLGTVTAEASGGDLIYSWYARKKNSADNQLVAYLDTKVQGGAFLSKSVCDIKNLTTEFDSCKLWCVIENECGYRITDTILIRVVDQVRLTVDRSVAYLCADATDGVKVELVPTNSACVRWSYSYRKVGEENGLSKNVYTLNDSLTLPSEGVYEIYDFYTSTVPCVADDTLKVVVKPRELFYAGLNAEGRDTVCRGELVRLRLKIEGGEAPWRVDIRRTSDRNTAPELGGAPVEIWHRDTIFEMEVIDDNSYYIASATQFMDPTACAGKVKDDTILYVIQQPYGTYLGKAAAGTMHFGACKTINLVTELAPYPDVPVGKFYIDGVLSGDNLLSGDPGEYKVVYKVSTSAGCADSARADLVLDPLPSGKLSIEKTDLCVNQRTNLVAEFEGTGKISYQIKSYSYNSAGKMIGRPGVLSGSTSDGYKGYEITYSSGLADSMRIYELASVTDKYGCSYTPENAEVKLLFRRAPLFRVTASNSSIDGGKETTLKDLVIPGSDKRVRFTVNLDNGIKPWYYFLAYKDSEGKDKIDKVPVGYANKASRVITAAGTYLFTVSDEYCSSTYTEERTITYLDSGYLKVKVMLQGAYNEKSGTMESTLWTDNLLPKKKWSAWPELGSRKGIDWVTVELRRDSVNGERFYSEEFLLLNDGSVVDRAGRETLPIPNADFKTSYYVVIKHRNHLSIGSAAGITLASEANNAPLMDLRLVPNVYCRSGKEITTHLHYIGQVNGTVVWGMYAGNVFGNSLISVNNANEGIIFEKSVPDYYKEDVNFDGKVTIPEDLKSPTGTKDDVSIMYQNRDKYSEIIE